MKQYVILTIIIFTSALVSNASTSLINDTIVISASDYSDAYEKVLKKNEMLTERRNAISDTLKKMEKEIKALEREYDSLRKNVDAKKKNASRQPADDNGVSLEHLVRQRDSLQNCISDNETVASNKEILIGEMGKRVKGLSITIDSLNHARDSIAENLLKKGKIYLHQPFPLMKDEELKQLQSSCERYSQTDKRVFDFLPQVEQTARNRICYCEALKVLEAPYNKFDVEKSFRALKEMRGIQREQQTDIDKACYSLMNYVNGLKAFKEFINNLNDKRKDVQYTYNYFEQDKPSIMKDGLDKRIEQYLLCVPFLKRKYAEFMKEFRANPNRHSAVEEEILNITI